MTDFHKVVFKAGQNCYQSYYLLSSFRDYPGLAKYRSLQPSVTFPIRRLLTSLCYSDRWSDQAALRLASITAASWQTINHLNSLIVQRNGSMLTESTRPTILPAIDLWILLSLSAKLNVRAGSLKSYHSHISETKVSFGLLGFSPSFGKDSDDEIATNS